MKESGVTLTMTLVPRNTSRIYSLLSPHFRSVATVQHTRELHRQEYKLTGDTLFQGSSDHHFACCVNFSTRETKKQFPVMPVAVFESCISNDWFTGVGRLDSKQQQFGASVRRLGGTLGLSVG